jgi:hypothetical protein
MEPVDRRRGPRLPPPATAFGPPGPNPTIRRVAEPHGVISSPAVGFVTVYPYMRPEIGRELDDRSGFVPPSSARPIGSRASQPAPRHSRAAPQPRRATAASRHSRVAPQPRRANGRAAPRPRHPVGPPVTCSRRRRGLTVTIFGSRRSVCGLSVDFVTAPRRERPARRLKSAETGQLVHVPAKRHAGADCQSGRVGMRRRAVGRRASRRPPEAARRKPEGGKATAGGRWAAAGGRRAGRRRSEGGRRRREGAEPGGGSTL